VVTPEEIYSVVGTQFNVKQRGNYFEVECYTGSVKVSSHHTSEELKGGEIYRYMNGTPSLGKTMYLNPQFTKNFTGFERVPMTEVIEELERQYNVKVRLENIGFDVIFTGGFVYESIENVLNR
jgi:ferric-dicitrate binding protein FerR (iron transport regulator)